MKEYQIITYLSREEDKQNISKNFLNLLILETSVAISNQSNNIPHLYDGVLEPQHEHDPVYVKIDYWKILLSTYEFLNNFYNFLHILLLIPSIYYTNILKWASFLL